MRFIGWESDVGARLSDAGVLLAPTPREGLGLTVLEAMARGVPVVATDAGGHRETIGGVEPTYLTPAGDSASMARGLRTLAMDAGERARYGEALRLAQQRKFSLALHQQALIELYVRHLDDGRRGSL